MAKQKLGFKIKGKNVSYEGYPERRPKDLMDILVKMGVDQAVVVTTFRENIENHQEYSDTQVMGMYSEAKSAREKKTRAKASSSPGQSAAAAAPPQPDTADEAERPQKILLNYRGKQLSYTGLLSGKRNAVLQLLSKQEELTKELAVETFHMNLPDDPSTDEQIWLLVQAVKDRKSRKNQSKGTDTEGSSGNGAAASRTAGSNTMDSITGMSERERDDLDNFILQVLQQPAPDVAELLRGNPKRHKDVDDNTELALTARMSGKIPVYLQEENSSNTKLIYATAHMSFEDFHNIVEKKFGRRMTMSFYDGDDIIMMDDDDVLTMFLEMTMQNDPKKVRLICSNPEHPKKVVDDRLTDTRQQSLGGVQVSTTKALAYSSGELNVSEIRSYSGHSLAVYCCCFSPRGDMFVTASRDRTVRLWNLRTGVSTMMKGGHNGFVLSCDYSPKGNRVASSSDDRTIKLWSTSSCNKVATLKGHEDKVYCVKYNATGELLVSASCDTTVRVWNAESQAKLMTLRGHSLAVFSCAFSNTDSGKFVVSGSDDRVIKLWDWGANREIMSLVGHIGTVWTVVFSHNDRYVLSGSMDYELILWDSISGTRLRSMDGHKASVHHAIFSEDDAYIFSCARDWSVMVWRTTDGEHIETIIGHLSTVYHMDIREDKLLTSSLDDKIKLWSIRHR
ncbi:conserved hypothetical protein [Leishmania major strain Friedlin]|uniref:Uncharacterized protein n=1 Tax=Leishmania major TaxID=5664 RepID=Q4QJ76_LEIMA|nr:conserved hypothetical protein [Leishmania major strain Friedlin]CAG9568795.1 WD_domain_-_G-beta_repeat_-_putative [Leishmania major strain Friedlin]CAJ02046.1 conserved hypothetical protein [Leishmania major strain Friedlin]|eukprot:XP_001680772.1 conserved hypothetical protein [Leishmania major strain Friedlin]